MHQQIKASPDNTAENVQRIVNALAARSVDIQAIAPDFDPPHVRVLVSHEQFVDAMSAMSDEGLTPEARSALLVAIPNKAGALKAAMDSLARRGFTVESVLVLPETPEPETARISFGVSRRAIAGWEDELQTVQTEIQDELTNIP